MFNLEQLIRPHIINLKPYASARDEYSGKEGVFLDANENPFPSPEGESYNRYPDPYQQLVKKRISELKEVPTENIFLGNGSDEVIDLLIRLFCNPLQDSIIIMPPTYGMYAVSADINTVGIVQVPLTTSYDIDVVNVLQHANEFTKLCFVCSPNNPSGNVMSRARIIELVEKFEGIVIVDEAYIDFSEEESFTQLLPQYPNLVVMQTLSKAWGLAALRLGMGFMSKDIIAYLNKIKPPYNISAIAQQAVLQKLNAAHQKEAMVGQLLNLRAQLEKQLKSLPMVKKIHPSQANFLLVEVEHADELYQQLIKHMVIVRNRSKVLLCDNCLRITVGTAEENVTLLEALQNLSRLKIS